MSADEKIHPNEDAALKEDVVHLSNAGPEGDTLLETRYAGYGRLQSAKVFWKAMVFCLILNWAALNDGFQQQVPGNIIPIPAFVNQFADITVNGQPEVSARVLSFWQGFPEMSKTLGMFIGGPIADRFGRKPAILFAVAVLLAGSIAQITVSNWQGWLGAAVLVRLGVGLAQTILVTYVSEISPAQIRGFMIGSYQLMLAFGQLIVAIAAQLVTEKTPTVYKSLIAIEFLFTGSLICVIWLVPESHIYHARKGNEEAAKRSMLRLYGTAPNYDVEWEYAVIKHGIEVEQGLLGGKASFFEIFQGNNWKRTLAGCVGICSQWSAGAPIVFSYSTYFFKVAGLADPFLVTVLTFVILIVAISVSLVACEYIGRRPLLVGGCAAMCLFNVGVATSGLFNSVNAGKAALGCLLCWVFCYGASAGPIGFVAAAETSTPHLRAATTSFNLGCYGLGFVVFQWSISYMISPDAANLGTKAIYVWAGLLVPTTVLLYFFYPETYGRTYLELDELYERRIPAWRFKHTLTAADKARM